MINTYNESSLHHTLKVLYAQRYNGETEQPYEKWICDIVTKDQSIIEIQTGSLSPLKAKTQKAVKDKRKIIIVHPIVTEKTIETINTDGKVLSKRKSPKKENLYSKLTQLTGFYDLLLNRYLTIIFVEIHSKEVRIKTQSKTLLPNKSRRFAKDWYKTDKVLTQLGTEYVFHGKKSWLKLLPALPEEFSSKELKEELFKTKKSASIASHANLILWLFSHMGLIEQTGTKERRKYYKLK
ncbi:MAG: hypothetical protein MJ169_05355 [Treponema sp.]|nr:hypothetical protein [Treponema sp.]